MQRVAQRTEFIGEIQKVNNPLTKHTDPESEKLYQLTKNKMPYGLVPHAEQHGVRIGLDISAVVFAIRLTKIKVKKIHPWVLWLEAYIPIMGWLTYQYYMTGAYKNKNKTY